MLKRAINSYQNDIVEIKNYKNVSNELKTGNDF